jgi:membrane protease YdiL (CAAX protease family)
MSKESSETKQFHKRLQPIILSRPTSKLEAFIKILGVAVLGFGLFIIGQLLPVIFILAILGLTGRDQDQITDLLENNSSMQLLVVAAIAVSTTFAVWRLLKWRGHDPKKFLMVDRRPSLSQLGEAVLTYGVYFIVLITASLLVGALTTVNVDQAQDLGVAASSGTGLIPIFVMLVILPPIFEEIFFRGFLYKYLSGFGGKYAGYVLTSVIFGAAHLEYGNLNWIAAIDTLIFSGFLIYISQKHQSLYSAMMLHAVKNGIAFYALFVYK